MRAKSILFSPALVFLIIGLLAGGLMSVFTPYGAGFDEETHLARIFDIAHGHLLPNRATPHGAFAYREFFSLSYQRRYFQTPAWDMFQEPLVSRTGDQVDLLEVQTRSIYNPLMFLPQALVVGVGWRIFTFPILPVVIAARLAGLLVYLGLVFAAVRLIPLGKWLLAVLGLAPMALFQAATLNTDGFTIGVSFLFSALALKLYAGGPEPLRRRDVWAAAGAALLLGFAKPGAILILPLLLLLPARRFWPQRLALALWGAALLALLVTVGWSAAAVSNSHFAAGGDQSVGRQLALVLAEPLDFISTFLRGVFFALPAYIEDWIGVYGYWAGEVPGLVYGFFLLAVLLAMAAEPETAWFRAPVRGLFVGTFVFAAGVTILMYFYANYAPGDASSLGKQGRYFLPMAPLFFLGLAGVAGLPRRKRSLVEGGAAAALLLALGFYGYGLYASYYTLCGELVYSGHVCMQPVYKNLDKAALPGVALDEDSLLVQEFDNTCERLVGVEVLVNSLPAQESGQLSLAIVGPTGETLAAEKFAFSALRAGEYARLKTDLGAGFQNQLLSIAIQAPEIDGKTLPQIATAADDYYLSGGLQRNGSPLQTDVIFHYVCELPARVGSK